MLFIAAPLLLCFFLETSKGDYRSYYIGNADLCGSRSSSNPLLMGPGALLLKLSQYSYSFMTLSESYKFDCQIHVKAPFGHGISLHVEDIALRQNIKSGKCLDYIQFGRNDILPFYTLRKTPQICSNSSLRFYEDPKGSLLIWIRLETRRKENKKNESPLKLTLVLTVYSHCKNPNQNEIKCSKSKKCIWKNYRCDSHFNCPENDGVPSDEMNCSESSETSFTELTPMSNSKLHFLSYFLLCFSLLISVILFFLLALRCNFCKNSRCPESQTGLSLAELSSRRHHSNTVQENIYCPLQGRNEQSPPPSYTDLFPEENQPN